MVHHRTVVTSCIIHQKWYRNDVLVRYFSALISFAVYLYMCDCHSMELEPEIIVVITVVVVSVYCSSWVGV